MRTATMHQEAVPDLACAAISLFRQSRVCHLFCSSSLEILSARWPWTGALRLLGPGPCHWLRCLDATSCTDRYFPLDEREQSSVAGPAVQIGDLLFLSSTLPVTRSHRVPHRGGRMADGHARPLIFLLSFFPTLFSLPRCLFFQFLPPCPIRTRVLLV